MERRKKKTGGGVKPPEKRLSSGLDSLLDAGFDNPMDPFSLYWDVAALLRDDERILVQKKIRRVLRKRGAISPESALLAACILSLSGFPAHRVLHFLSVYFTGGLNQSLFDLAVGTIFLGGSPIDPPLMYDMTQYTYLEKRLLARRSIEISDLLKKDLSPGLLLFMYLLSLRSDLSNENVQLIALIMKNCFPAQEVRTRLGVVSLEEYGEIARAWKEAEERTVAAEQLQAAGPSKAVKKSFSLDKASFFLDRYFSDAALEQMQAKAPPLAIPKRPPRIERPRAADVAMREREADAAVDLSASAGPSFSRAAMPSDVTAAVKAPRTPWTAKPRAPEPGFVTRSREAAPGPAASLFPPAVAAKPPVTPRGQGASPRSAPPSRPQAARSRGNRKAGHAVPPAPVAAHPWLKGSRRIPSLSLGTVMTLVPFIVAVCVSAVALFEARSLLFPATAPVTAAPVTPAAPAAVTATPAPPAAVTATPAPPAATYVVQEGDSLWAIFKARGGSKGNSMGWVDFLSTMRETNALGNPDRIRPGNVLTLTAPDR